MFDGTVSVVMPAYNESSHIDKSLRITAETLDGFGYDFEIIVVDDGSKDGTWRIASRTSLEYPGRIRVVTYDRNRGKGGALTAGTRFARGKYVVFLDADMDLHPEQLPLFFEILSGSAGDVVIGSKRHPLSNVSYPLTRHIYSFCYYSLVRLMFGLPVKDTQTGLKLFRAEVLHRCLPRLKTTGFAFDIELLANAHRLGYGILEAPVTLNFQREKGRIRPSDVIRIARDTFGVAWRMRVRRQYDGDYPAMRLEEWPVDRHSIRIEAADQPLVEALHD